MNKPEIVAMLVKHGADVNIQATRRDRNFFQGPLHFAAKQGDTYDQTLAQLLKSPKVDKNALNSDGEPISLVIHLLFEVHIRQYHI